MVTRLVETLFIDNTLKHFLILGFAKEETIKKISPTLLKDLMVAKNIRELEKNQ